MRLRETFSKLENKFHDLFNLNTKFSVQEEAITSLVKKILAMPGTIKYTPFNGNMYLVNKEMKYCVRIKDSHISIVSSSESITRTCTPEFSYYLQKVVNKKLQEDVDGVEETFFNSEMTLLEKLDTGLTAE